VVVAVEREGDAGVGLAERDRAKLALGPAEAAAAPGDGDGEVRPVFQPGDLTRHGDLSLTGEGERGLADERSAKVVTHCTSMPPTSWRFSGSSTSPLTTSVS